MFAVLTTGGKQYRVESGSELLIERVAGEAGSTITFDRVLLVGDGDEVTLGTPTVAGATVTGTVLGEALGPKIVVFKFKQKVKYRRHTGHRQHLTRVRIDEISGSGKPKAERRSRKPAEPEATAGAEAAADASGAETAAEATPDAADKPKRARRTAAAKPRASRAKAKDEPKADESEE